MLCGETAMWVVSFVHDPVDTKRLVFWHEISRDTHCLALLIVLLRCF